jgi:dihydropteroate synthase
MKLQCAEYLLDLSTPKVMGILNVTPDSFSDGGQFTNIDAAIAHAQQLIDDGADIIDIGGESTRPGATPVPLETELQRVIPVIQALAKCGVALSIDTYKPAVMQAAIKAGVHMVNDVFALQQPGAIEAVQDSAVGLCLMHMQGNPQTMQLQPQYQDVVQEVRQFLQQRVSQLSAAGIAKQRIAIDPGFGFGKKNQHNLTLLKQLAQIRFDNLPILAGLSRKSILGQLAGGDPSQRLYASLAASVLAVSHGANIVRVHDVKATVEALKVTAAVLQKDEG